MTDNIGSRSIIIPHGNHTIRKKIINERYGHSLELQKSIHRTAYDVLRNFRILTTPSVSDDQNYYIMDRIDTSKPIWLGDTESYSIYDANLIIDLRRELVRFWTIMWNNNFAPWDFELYLQPDSRVMMIDYDKYGIRTESGIRLPVRINMDDFFIHPSFPKGFRGLTSVPAHHIR